VLLISINLLSSIWASSEILVDSFISVSILALGGSFASVFKYTSNYTYMYVDKKKKKKKVMISSVAIPAF
jgi:hypothetical protein